MNNPSDLQILSAIYDRYVNAFTESAEKSTESLFKVYDASWWQRAPFMAKLSKRHEPVREARITDEIVVDAYGPEEQAVGWYCYLEEKLQFPFTAICVTQRPISPLRVDDEVDVIGMAPDDECQREMFVLIHKGELAVPLSQLKPTKGGDDQTCEAIADWHYWVRMGY